MTIIDRPVSRRAAALGALAAAEMMDFTGAPRKNEETISATEEITVR